MSSENAFLTTTVVAVLESIDSTSDFDFLIEKGSVKLLVRFFSDVLGGGLGDAID